MPLDFDRNDSNFLAYFKITLSGETLYWGNRYATLDDGTAIDGLLVNMNRLNRSTGSLLDPRIELPSMAGVFDNRPAQDGTRAQDLVDTYEWANAPCELWVGQGVAVASFEQLFKGFVKFPGGISWRDETLTVHMTDAREKDGRYLPASTYTLAVYPNMEVTKVNRIRPIVIGDWQTSVAGGQGLPATQVDRTVATGGRFDVSAYCMKSIQTVTKNGYTAAYSNVQLTASGTTFDLDESYTAGTDEIVVYGVGATDDNTSSGAAVELAHDIFEWVLEYPMGVASADIDDTALSVWGANLSTSRDKMRRYINAEIHSDELLAQLLSEGFADLGIEDGLYYPRYRIVSLGGSLPQLMEEDLSIAGENAGREFEGQAAPDEIYTNEVVASYQYNPITLAFDGREEQEDTAQIAAKGQRVRRSMTLNWLYLSTGVGDRVARELYVFANSPELIELHVGAAGVVLEPSEQFRVVYNKWTADSAGYGVPFQVRDIQTDVLQMMAIILAWNILSLGTGTWTADSALTWNTDTVANRRTKGYWTDGSGYADDASPYDTASQVYRFL